MKAHPVLSLGCGLLVGVCGLATKLPHVAAQSPTFTHIATIPGPFDLIQVRESRAYVAAQKTLTVVDYPIHTRRSAWARTRFRSKSTASVPQGG